MAARKHRSSRPTEHARTTPDDSSIVDETTPSGTDGLAAAIEREQLRARVRALERELAASERHRQGLIEQYERLLDERDRETVSVRRTETSQSPLGRLLSRE